MMENKEISEAIAEARHMVKAHYPHHREYKVAQALLDVIARQNAPSQAAPTGMVLVPEKITGPMLDAWFSSHGDNRETDNDAFFQPRWTALLAAAPLPQRDADK